jgi:Putative MetA-pathway of phenol degradation
MDMKRETSKMARKVMTILGFVLAFAGVANPGLAQTQATKGAPPSGEEGASAAAMAQEAANPFASSWLMQTQQNNNWIDMPGSDGDRVQSNLLFEPLMNVRLTEKVPLFIRPMMTIVNSLPGADRNGHSERTSGFGDTVLAFVIPRPLLGGRLTFGAGPTFVFPTASRRQLGQDTWQVGPDAGAVLLGRRFISYAFVQQWFKVGGDGRNTSQMNGVFNYTYTFENGWTIGTQPNLSVDWEAPEDEGTTFSIGPQVGKLCKCGGTPTLFQLQFQYHAIHPDVAGPKWNIQLQVTPTIPSLLKKKLF